MSRPKGRNQISGKVLTHEQVVVLALMLIGGDSSPVDTEDVALKADEIAPGRFRWRKHPQYINNELVHTALRDAKRLGGLVRGAGSEGWQLTTAGLELVEKMKSQGIAAAESRRSLDPKERAWLNKERIRLLSNEAYRKYTEGGAGLMSRRDAEHFFRLDDYVTGEVRAARLQRIVNHFGSDPELGGAVHALAELAK
jgi:hypothetical protein